MKKQHCPKGHKYTFANTVIKHTKTGTTRRCKQCMAALRHRYKNKLRLKKSLIEPSSLKFKLTRVELRKLVDVVWSEATESTAVPSTKWADKLIDRALSTFSKGNSNNQ